MNLGNRMQSQNKTVLKLNHFCAIGIVLWMCIPWFTQNTGLLIGAFLVAVWIITAWLYKTPSFIIGKDGLWMILWAFLMLLSYIFFGRVYANFTLRYFLPMLILFFIPYYMAKFYIKNKDFKFLAYIAIFAMLGMIVGSLTSIYYSNIIPGIMKSVTQSENEMANAYRTKGIGGFGFVYMVMFCVITIMSVFGKLENGWLRILSFVFCVISIVCLIASTFTTALIFVVVGILLIKLSGIKNKSILYFMYILLPILFLLLANILGDLLLHISLENEGLTTRLNEIGEFLLSGELGHNLDSRVDRFKMSWECFTHYPLFGYNFQESPKYVVGTHSEWIDIFACYGIVGAVVVFSALFCKLNYINQQLKQEIKVDAYSVIILILFLYGFLDPILRIYHTGLAVFLIVPGLFWLPTLNARGAKK